MEATKVYHNRSPSRSKHPARKWYDMRARTFGNPESTVSSEPQLHFKMVLENIYLKLSSCLYIHTDVYLHFYPYLYLYPNLYLYPETCSHLYHLQIHIHICVCIILPVYIHIYIYTCMYVCMYVCMHVWIYLSISRAYFQVASLTRLGYKMSNGSLRFV